MHTRYDDAAPFATKDGSLVRELRHPARHGNRAQSLAEAIVAPGVQTALHRHLHSEELYHISAGTGQMTLGEKIFSVAAGDTVHIAPGTPHCIRNTGNGALRILCCCTP